MSDQATPKLKAVLAPGDVPALELTAAFANKTNCTMNALTTRIAFGEFVAGDQNKDINYHTVVVLPTPDAVTMAQLILALFQDNQPAQNLLRSLPAIAGLPESPQRGGQPSSLK